MAADSETGRKGIGTQGRLVALATILSGLATAYAVAKDEARSVCAMLSLDWCQSGQATEIGGNGRTDFPPTPSAPAGQGIAISVEPLRGSDAGQAATLLQDLRGELGSVGAAASGYQIEGVVSDFVNTPSRRSRFTFSWTIRRGLVSVQCKDVPVSYPSNMGSAAAQVVSAAISPSIAESVKYQDVRCS